MRILVLVLTLSALVGCSLVRDGSELISENDEKHFQRAKRKLREGDDAEALQAFMKVIAKRKEAPESHLEAGRLYLRHKKDPVEAIHHFRRYLEYEPKSPHAQSVRGLIDTARKEFARQLPGQPFQEDLSRLDLIEFLKQVQSENAVLRSDLAEAKDTIKNLEAALAPASKEASSRKVTPLLELPVIPATSSAVASGRTYTVRSGDTLSKISMKVYGIPTRWQSIYEANQDTLPNENALKVGQVLKLP